MMNIFDGGFKKKQHPPQPPIYGFCLSDLSMANNKEGGNETKMKRLKGGEEVCLLSDGAHTSSKRQRGGNERAWRTAEKRHKYCSIGPVRESERKKKCIATCLSEELEIRGWVCFVFVCVLGWLVVSHCSVSGWSLEGAASRCWVMGVVGDKGRRRRGDKGGRREETAHGSNKKLYRQQQKFH